MPNINHNSTTSSSCQTLLRKLAARQNLTQKEAGELLRALMAETLSDTLSDTLKAALITALAAKGETVEEITGMARAMRELSVKVPARNPLLDTCGTGGSGLQRLNVSTASASILAACGVRVAKHGNRAASGRTGSFDVLEALGAKIELEANQVAETIKQTNLGFIYAPLYHPAMKSIMPVRKELGIRTVFNILGPLTNPAHPHFQVLGVSNPKLGHILISVLQNLGAKRALVVYGEDGLDEITVTAPTHMWELTNDGAVKSYTIQPENFGIRRVPFNKIKGGNAAYNARVISGILEGAITDARRDIVLLNAAAGLYIYGRARSIKQGIAYARKAIDSGKVKEKLENYIAISNTV